MNIVGKSDAENDGIIFFLHSENYVSAKCNRLILTTTQGTLLKYNFETKQEKEGRD